LGGKRFSEIPPNPPLEKGGEGGISGITRNPEQNSSRKMTCFWLRQRRAVFICVPLGFFPFEIWIWIFSLRSLRPLRLKVSEK
jgi:hypothetical protein